MKSPSPRTRIAAGVLLITVGGLSLSACSTSDAPTTGGSADIALAAAFYPLAYVAEHVAGDHADLMKLTAPGIEPHDLELSPAVVRDLQNQDIVLYLSDFQAAVDDAIAVTGVTGFDVADVINLLPAGQHEGGADGADAEHAEGAFDPHFWLDPTLLSTYATAVGNEFGELDPDNAADYSSNAAELASQLGDLDKSYSTGLANCERKDLYTTHEAFGYLADRYGLHEEGLSGIDPEAEPSPARVREIRDLMAADGSTTIFTESLVSANVAEALASDAGVATEVLDPIEGVVGDDDYMSVMNRNLASLRGALGCS